MRSETSGKRAIVRIDDEIGAWGVSASDFYRDLKETAGNDRPVDVHVNSPGGHVFDGIAIYNMLKDHRGKVTTYVDGIAASMASIIVLAGDTVVMPENYIAMFATPTREAARKIIEKAEKRITQAVDVIRSGEEFAEPVITITDRLISGIVNDLFYPVCVHAKKFYVTDACISCGKCERVCPTQNVHLESGRPVIADSGSPKTAVYVLAGELLEQVVCSAYQTHGLWRVSAAKDHRVGKAARYWPKLKMRR